MKVCSTCKMEKDLSEFAKNPQKKDGLNYKCKECQKRYFKKHYEKNKQYYVDKSAKRKKANAEKNRELKAKLKSDGCCLCGEKHPATLDFHHMGEKTFTIARKTQVSHGRMKRELDKCIVVCSNCHRKIHWDHLTD